MRSSDVTGIAFDNLSSFFIMTTKRGTMHAFAVPNPQERKTLDPNNLTRSKISYEIPKGIDFHCKFDLSGYLITAVSSNGLFKQVRLDIEKNLALLINEKKLDL